jgi:hypothetical protein
MRENKGSLPVGVEIEAKRAKRKEAIKVSCARVILEMLIE